MPSLEPNETVFLRTHDFLFFNIKDVFALTNYFSKTYPLQSKCSTLKIKRIHCFSAGHLNTR